jgi:glycosyltransferase involved in cell wall biosynthesis
VRVVPLGVGEAFLRAPERGPAGRRYLFYAGNRRAHKDLPTLFRAWSELPPDCAIDLHLTGRDDLGSALDPYRRADARIVFAGELDTAGLIAAYRGALALVHPSLAEGFGLTLLEASVLGVPVVAAETSVPRILAAIASPFPPGDSGALRALLERLIREPEPFEAKARAGAAEARGFTWDRCAAATAAVYREAIVPR